MDGLLTHFTKPLLSQTPRRIAIRVALIVGILTLAACDAATPTPTRTPQPINTLEPAAAVAVATATEMVPAVVEAAATVAPPTAVPNDTGVSLILPPSLAQSYGAQLQTAITGTEGPAFGGAAPVHVLITFDQEQIQYPGNPRERQIRVYPISGLRAIDPFVGEEIDKLQALLEKKPANIEDSITVLPVQNAAQVFHTQVKYLDFANGSGVRFLSAYAQDITPITNENIFYTFQGLTSDGQYYISAFYPISSTALPGTFEESTAAQNMDEFTKSYTSKYLPGVAEGLNSLPSDQFIPDLSELDNLVQSLNALPVAAVPTDTISSTSIVITATVVETPTEAAPMTAVTATESITAAAETPTVAVSGTATAAVSEATTTPTEIVTPTTESTATTSATPSATDATAALQPAGEATVRAQVNVRSLPTTQARVLTQLSRNSKVQLLGRSPRSNWLYVLLEDGQRGWIAVSFLQTTVSVRGLPVVS